MYISSDIVRKFVGRADLTLFVDGIIVERGLTFTSNKSWEGGHVTWSGPLSSGTHTVWLTSPNAVNAWGCGSLWGAIDTIIFE